MPPVDEPTVTEPITPTPATTTEPVSAPEGDDQLLAGTPDDGDEPDDGIDISFLQDKTPSTKPAAEPAAASPGTDAAVTPATVAPPATPAQPAATTPPAAPAAVATPPVVPQQPVAPATAPAAPVPPAAVQPQAQPVQQPTGDPLAPYKKWRSDGENLLATTHFKLSPELAEEVAGDPATAIPKLMARVYMDSVENAVQATANILPQLIYAVNAQQQAQTKAEEQFFGKWPQLREHSATVAKIGQNWRGMNPNGTADEYMQQVGAQAIVALGLLNTLTNPAPQQQVQTQPSGLAPHRPLSVSAPRQVGLPGQPSNQFEQLALEPLYDD